MSGVSDFLLTQILSYGAPFLALAMFWGGLGAPFPLTLVVVAIGAFGSQGYLNWPLTAVVGLISVVLGDSLSFRIGRIAQSWVDRRYGDSANYKKALALFEAHGGKTIFLSRFLLTPIAVPTNLIAGGSHFGFRRFLYYDVIGETIWVFGYGGLGYLFGTQWELISDFLNDFGWFSLGVVAVGILIYYLFRQANKQKKKGEVL